jgi:hypothetical protein
LIKRAVPVAWAVAWTAAVTFVLLRPSDGTPRWPFLAWPGVDKLIHLVLFGVMATLWQRATLARNMHILGPVVVYGLITEVVQHHYIPGRSGSALDLAADALGATLALWVAGPFISRSWNQGKPHI